MKRLTCEMCGSTDLIKDEGVFVCQSCGMKYSVEEAKKMMIEGTVDVQGTVKVDNSAFVEKYLDNARRAYVKEDWEEVEKYYNMVEQNAPRNMEAVFFSSFGKAMLSLSDTEYFKRSQKFTVLNNSISVINDYFEETTENKEDVLRKIYEAIDKMDQTTFVYNNGPHEPIEASRSYTNQLKKSVRVAFIKELKQIREAHLDLKYLDELIGEKSIGKESIDPVKTCVRLYRVYKGLLIGSLIGWSIYLLIGCIFGFTLAISVLFLAFYPSIASVILYLIFRSKCSQYGLNPKEVQKKKT